MNFRAWTLCRDRAGHHVEHAGRVDEERLGAYRLLTGSEHDGRVEDPVEHRDETGTIGAFVSQLIQRFRLLQLS